MVHLILSEQRMFGSEECIGHAVVPLKEIERSSKGVAAVEFLESWPYDYNVITI